MQVELRKKQEEARQLFEYEKARMRKEAEELAAAAEAELHEEEEKALSALRARRKERLKVVEAKRAELRRKLEDSFVEKQMKLKEEHLEKEQEKLTLVSRTFGFFGKKKKNRPSVRAASQTPDAASPGFPEPPGLPGFPGPSGLVLGMSPASEGVSVNVDRAAPCLAKVLPRGRALFLQHGTPSGPACGKT